MNTVFIGIDPGTKGAIAVLWSSEDIDFFEMNGSDHDLLDWLREAQRVAAARGLELRAVLEKVTSYGQGRKSAFTFGRAWGSVRMALLALGIPIACEPVPNTWKRAVFGGKVVGDAKTVARDKARDLYPAYKDEFKLKKDADKAEALLLSFYGSLVDKRG